MHRAKKGGASKLAAPPVTFRDVAGLDTAKEELLEVVACLRDARRYARLNAKTPSGVLLTGPPGTGKTLLGATPWVPPMQESQLKNAARISNKEVSYRH